MQEVITIAITFLLSFIGGMIGIGLGILLFGWFSNRKRRK